MERRTMKPTDPRTTNIDDLRAARGIFNATLLSLAFWAVVINALPWATIYDWMRR